MDYLTDNRLKGAVGRTVVVVSRHLYRLRVDGTDFVFMKRAIWRTVVHNERAVLCH
jgi:hypothetical protein